MKRTLLVLLLAACGEGTLEVEEGGLVDDEVPDDGLASQALTVDGGVTVATMEAQITTALSDYRVSKGLRPYVSESRLHTIAVERANYMLANRAAGCSTWFTHQTLSGCTVTTEAHVGKLIASEIGTAWVWYLWGENIAWNNYPDELAAGAMMNQWKNSPGHDALMRSIDFNYVGIGVAKDAASGIKVGVMVFLEGKDLTKPRATSLTASTTSTGSTSIHWGGGTDTFVYAGVAYPLQKHNAGFKNYDLWYRRTGSTTWTAILSGTTATGVTKTFTAGVSWDLRLRIRDNNGNIGSRSITYVR